MIDQRAAEGERIERALSALLTAMWEELESAWDGVGTDADRWRG